MANKGHDILDDQTTEKVNTFSFLGYHVSYFGETDITRKIKIISIYVDCFEDTET
jgi:hypothetical protein